MPFDARIDRIALKNGASIRMPDHGITAIVGGNNVGKSTLLRETREALIDGSLFANRVVAFVEIEADGSVAEFREWFNAAVPPILQNGMLTHIPINGSAIRAEDVASLWNAVLGRDVSISGFGPLGPSIVLDGDVHSRLQGTEPTPRRSSLNDRPAHPLHHLESNEALRGRVTDLFFRIFREGLTLDWLSGAVQLRVGRISVAAPTVDAVTDEYTRALAALPPLQEQGDGMKSLMGLVLPLVTAHERVVIIDEPEAFLHPPQARELGRFIGQLTAERALQVLVATHDRSFLLGLLESSETVGIVRLDRDGDTFSSASLAPESVTALWENAAFRYSNALEGLFHRGVVLAESDADCRFYQASMDALHQSYADDGSNWPYAYGPGDILFVPANGKDGFPALVTALRSAATPVAVVADMDVLNEPAKFQRLCESLGADWTDLSELYARALAGIRTKDAPRTVQEVLSQVSHALEPHSTERFDRENGELLRQVLRQQSPWQDVKAHGEEAFRGDERRSLEELISKLDKIGLVLVRAGELEGLAPRVSSRKGARWLREALSTDAYKDGPAQRQVKFVADSLGGLYGLRSRSASE